MKTSDEQIQRAKATRRLIVLRRLEDKQRVRLQREKKALDAIHEEQTELNELCTHPTQFFTPGFLYDICGLCGQTN